MNPTMTFWRDRCRVRQGHLAMVRALVFSRIHPNVLTLIGLLIGIVAAACWPRSIPAAGFVIMGAAVFVCWTAGWRVTNQVTRFGGFFDSVLDRYSDLGLLMGLLVYYASINRFFYVVLVAIVMTGAVMVSYTRARAENVILKCGGSGGARADRALIIGTLFDRMAPVLWVTPAPDGGPSHVFPAEPAGRGGSPIRGLPKTAAESHTSAAAGDGQAPVLTLMRIFRSCLHPRFYGAP
jgi:CDP-diacylglycerol--glycerol-3-phosphate 3-phosphatidyltransferase